MCVSRMHIDTLSQIQLCQWLMAPTTHSPSAGCQCHNLQELFMLLTLLWLKSSLANLAHVPKPMQQALLGLI